MSRGFMNQLNREKGPEHGLPRDLDEITAYSRSLLLKPEHMIEESRIITLTSRSNIPMLYTKIRSMLANFVRRWLVQRGQ